MATTFTFRQQEAAASANSTTTAMTERPSPNSRLSYAVPPPLLSQFSNVSSSANQSTVISPTCTSPACVASPVKITSFHSNVSSAFSKIGVKKLSNTKSSLQQSLCFLCGTSAYIKEKLITCFQCQACFHAPCVGLRTAVVNARRRFVCAGCTTKAADNNKIVKTTAGKPNVKKPFCNFSPPPSSNPPLTVATLSRSSPEPDDVVQDEVEAICPVCVSTCTCEINNFPTTSSTFSPRKAVVIRMDAAAGSSSSSSSSSSFSSSSFTIRRKSRKNNRISSLGLARRLKPELNKPYKRDVPRRSFSFDGPSMAIDTIMEKTVVSDEEVLHEVAEMNLDTTIAASFSDPDNGYRIWNTVSSDDDDDDDEEEEEEEEVEEERDQIVYHCGGDQSWWSTPSPTSSNEKEEENPQKDEFDVYFERLLERPRRMPRYLTVAPPPPPPPPPHQKTLCFSPVLSIRELSFKSSTEPSTPTTSGFPGKPLNSLLSSKHLLRCLTPGLSLPNSPSFKPLSSVNMKIEDRKRKASFNHPLNNKTTLPQNQQQLRLSGAGVNENGAIGKRNKVSTEQVEQEMNVPLKLDELVDLTRVSTFAPVPDRPQSSMTVRVVTREEEVITDLKRWERIPISAFRRTRRRNSLPNVKSIVSAVRGHAGDATLVSAEHQLELRMAITPTDEATTMFVSDTTMLPSALTSALHSPLFSAVTGGEENEAPLLLL